jgi:hypothetical protein
MPLLDRVDGKLAFHLPPEQLPVSVAIVRMGHQREGLANELVSRTARELAVGFVDVEDTPILVDFGDAYGHVVVYGPQPSLTPVQDMNNGEENGRGEGEKSYSDKAQRPLEDKRVKLWDEGVPGYGPRQHSRKHTGSQAAEEGNQGYDREEGNERNICDLLTDLLTKGVAQCERDSKQAKRDQITETRMLTQFACCRYGPHGLP